MNDINHIGQLKPDPKNARKHNQRNIGQIVSSLQEVGAARSIVIDEDNIILAGNGVIEAAGIAGIENVRVIEADGNEIIAVKRTGLTPEQKTRLALWDNRAAELAEWDVDQLQIDFDSGMLDGMFSDIDLDKLGLDTKGEQPEDAEPQIDKAEELRVKWGVELGQLWQLGEHRLICGDCTDKAVVDRVMDGEKADMVFTDPPYGVDYEGGAGNEKKREKIQGDKTGDLFMPALKIYKSVCVNSAPMYIWFASSIGKPVYDAVESIGYKVRAMIIWNKLDAHYGAFMAQYMNKHEPCLYIVNGNANWIGATNEVTVWDVKQPSRNENHPTEKPIELAERAIGNHKADIVADFFLGSGTTIIACERLGRKCRAVEISPAYCAVAIQRWVDVTGGEPVLLT